MALVIDISVSRQDYLLTVQARRLADRTQPSAPTRKEAPRAI